MPDGAVRLEYDDHLAILTLDRPEQLNAMSDHMEGQLWAAFEELHARDDIYCVLWRGRGSRVLGRARDVSELGNRPPGESDYQYIAFGHGKTHRFLVPPRVPDRVRDPGVVHRWDVGARDAVRRAARGRRRQVPSARARAWRDPRLGWHRAPVPDLRTRVGERPRAHDARAHRRRSAASRGGVARRAARRARRRGDPGRPRHRGHAAARGARRGVRTCSTSPRRPSARPSTTSSSARCSSTPPTTSRSSAPPASEDRPPNYRTT